MTCGLQQRRASLMIELVDVGLRIYQPLAYMKVLLHAGECQGRLPSLVFFPGISPEPQQELDYLEVPVDARFHERGKREGVLPVDVEKLAGVNFRPCQLRPLQEDTLCQLEVPAACRDVQGVATVFIGDGQIHVLLK